MQPPSTSFVVYPQPGEVVDGKYRIERLLGEGGMGAVAKATHILRRAPVALKFISGAILSFPGAIERFVNEGVAASQIDSDHVVKVFDVGRLPSGAPYLVMEFLDGRDLGELLSAEGPLLHPPRAVHFALQMLRALQTAHNAGIVHRDMKPSNCFVIEKDGEPDFVKLVDFGISKVRTSDDGSVNANLTRTNSALGTPLYMSPEQARSPRDVDHRSDLYSVGAILYEMLGGRTPYTSETGEYTEILFKIFTTEPEPLAALNVALSEGLAAVVHRALQRNPDARFASALEMAEALAPFADARSATLLAKLRTARARSVGPSGPLSLPARSDQSSAPETTAASRILASAVSGDPSLRAPNVPTDIGLTRDAAPQSHTTRNAALVGGLAAAILVSGAMGAVLLSRGSRHVVETPPDNVQSAGAGVTGITTIVERPPPAPERGVVGLPPLAGTPLGERSASPSTVSTPPSSSSGSMTPHHAPPLASAPATPPSASVSPAPTSSSTLPRQLSDLKLH